jgi:hypothetical protein
MILEDYKSENCEVTMLSALSGVEAERLIGKTIAKLDASEDSLIIHFTDGAVLHVNNNIGDSTLGVIYRVAPGAGSEKPILG